MKSSEYWEKAALLRAVAIQDGAVYTTEEILQLYNEALEDIDEEIRKIYYNWQKRIGADEETAVYLLDRAKREENLNNLIYLLENAPDEKARLDILEYIHRDGLSVRAYAARAERYEVVKEQIYIRIKQLAVKEIAIVKEAKKQAYKESYYGLIDDTAKGLNMGINFAVLNDRAIDEAVSAKWHGERFFSRIWKHTDDLAEKAQKLVTKAVMSGESLTKTSAKLAEQFEVSKYQATTLVRTETAHIHNMADMKGYEDLGIEEYKYLATLDYKTCEICQPLDGRVFKRSEAREGINYPTMHPNCRCTTTMNMTYTQRRARNPLTGRNEVIDGNITYKEWRENLTPEQEEALQLAQKKDSRRTADKLQFEKYKNVLGTKVTGRSFDKWQDIKLTEPDKWQEMKALYRQKSSLDKSVKNDIINVRGDDLAEIIKLGKIDTQLLKKEFGDLKTDEIIITNERIAHIKLHHPEDYKLFEKYGVNTVEQPDRIIKDCKNKGTVFMIKQLENTNLNIVSRLVLTDDDDNLKNSVMTFYRIRQKNLEKLEKKNKLLYKKE